MPLLTDLAKELSGRDFPDCGGPVHHPDFNVYRLLFALDLSGLVVAAAKGSDADLLVIHHSVGPPFYRAHRRVSHRAQSLRAQGFDAPDAIIADEVEATRATLTPMNRLSDYSALPTLGITCLSAHSNADALVQTKLLDLFSTVPPSKAVATLRQWAADVGFTDDSALVVHGTLPRTARHPYIDIENAAPPSLELVRWLTESGCDLIISTHQPVLSVATPQVCLNHIPYDLCALELMATRLVARYLDIEAMVLETGRIFTNAGATSTAWCKDFDLSPRHS